MERKKKMKIKKKKTERRIPRSRIEKEVKKKKKAILDQWKRTKILQARLPLKIILDYIPPHMNKEEKTETSSFLSKNTNLEKILLVRDRTIGLWFYRKSCAK